METPNKMIGGIAGAMTGALGGATSLEPQQPVQQNQMIQSPINPSILGGFNPQKLTGVPNPTQSFNNTMPQAGIVGQTALGQYDKIMPNKL